MTARQRIAANVALLLVVAALVTPWQWVLSQVPDVVTKTPVAAVYVYEKDRLPPTPAISRALIRINKETEIDAGETDDDNTTNERFAASIRAAEGKVPCLVLTYGDGTTSIIENPDGPAILKAVGLE